MYGGNLKLEIVSALFEFKDFLPIDYPRIDIDEVIDKHIQPNKELHQMFMEDYTPPINSKSKNTESEFKIDDMIDTSMFQ